MKGVTKYEDLIAWQLSAQLRDAIVKLTEEGPASKDAEFAKQLRKSSSSSASNMAEGFGAFYPKEFARFGRIARRSLIETRNHLKDGRQRGYFSEETTNKLVHLSFRAHKATTRLIKYLTPVKAARLLAGRSIRQPDRAYTGYQNAGTFMNRHPS